MCVCDIMWFHLPPRERVVAARQLVASSANSARARAASRVGRGAALRGVELVAAGRDVELVDDRGRLDRVEHELEERVPGVGGQRAVDRFGARAPGRGTPRRRAPPRGNSPGCRCAAPAAPACAGRCTSCSLRRGRRSRRRAPAPNSRVGPRALVVRPALRPAIARIPRVVAGRTRSAHSIGLRSPTLTIQRRVGAVARREVHLLPDLGQRHRVEPLVVARAADVVEVVVDAGAAGAFALLRPSAGGGCCPSCRRTTAASRRRARACPARSSPALPCRAPRPAAPCVTSGFRCVGDQRRAGRRRSARAARRWPRATSARRRRRACRA